MTRWFALAVRPRFDQAVARALERRGHETFLPLYRRHDQSGARPVEAELPLFPGYVCCRFDVRNRMPILATPGVIHILGAGNTPAALDDIEVASLQTAIRSQFRIQPFPFIQAGQRVRIQSGELAGVVGIVMSFGQTLRLVLSITLLQRSVLVEIGRDAAIFSTSSNTAPFELVKGD